MWELSLGEGARAHRDAELRAVGRQGWGWRPLEEAHWRRADGVASIPGVIQVCD